MLRAVPRTPSSSSGRQAARATADALAPYRRKRDFERTPEPPGDVAAAAERLAYVIQKHAATRLHYDLRLELDGVMLSWAVPKGPSYDPTERRMAVQVEDHPVAYNTFEGTIPKGQYGAGSVIVWDRGTWEPIGDPHAGLAEGKLVFALHGQKLRGAWELVRIAKPGERQIPWLLFKKRDGRERSKSSYDVVSALPDSVVAKPAATPDAAKAEPADALAAAVRAQPPARLAPQLATLSTGLPRGGDWIFEIKFDGYRLMTRFDDAGKPHLITRGGHDWSDRMKALRTELAGLGLRNAWLDGEIVVLGDGGTPNFVALQNAFDRGGRSDAILYFLFDVPFFEGHDLRAVPLRARRALLRRWLEAKTLERIRYSADFDADPDHILQSAARMRLEGIIAKRADAPYVSARTETWLKLKCRQRQEFVVAGYTDRGDAPSAAEIGSLVLGVHDAAGRLVPVGNVGAGWDSATAADLKRQLLPLARKTSPFPADLPLHKSRWSKRSTGTERWVEPRLVAEVSFADWTPDNQIRHAVFEGLRADKAAREVVRESALAPRDAVPLRSAATATTVSHPERVIDPGSGLTKLDLVRYYESVADWMLPHLAGRPCSLVRGPNGIGGTLFFQKHAETLAIPELKQLDPRLWPGHEPLIEVSTARALAGAAQMNVIEFHTWNAHADRIGKPDRMVFDIDPGAGVAWQQVQEAAALLRSFLRDLGLESWLKTSGGKGLHVVVPIAPRHDWDTVKGYTQAVVEHVARVVPSRFVARSGASNRVGKIYVDYLRNSHGATTAAAYSARARPGLGVSMPVAWDVLDTLKSGAQWTIATAREHLSFATEDPWKDYWTSGQSLTEPFKRLGYKAPRTQPPASRKRPISRASGAKPSAA
ncbi:MAG: DNA ligase D [Proteobacteria bacterium]|nr:DNA ligase D [Pseudomonadota bacterium]